MSHLQKFFLTLGLSFCFFSGFLCTVHFLNLQYMCNSCGSLAKDTDSVDLMWGLRFCFSNKFSGISGDGYLRATQGSHRGKIYQKKKAELFVSEDNSLYVLWIVFFFFFNGFTLSILQFLGQVLNHSCSCDLYNSCSNAHSNPLCWAREPSHWVRFTTGCATVGTPESSFDLYCLWCNYLLDSKAI